MEKKIKINTELYSEDIINQAISDFKEVSEIIFQNNNLEIKWDSEEEIDEIFNEFMNYCVSLVNEK